MKTQLMIAAAALIALGAPALASAAPVKSDGDVRQAIVSYADLNLATPVGQASLQSRIRHAARMVCGAEPDNRSVGAVQDYMACVNKTIGAANAAAPAATLAVGPAGQHG